MHKLSVDASAAGRVVGYASSSERTVHFGLGAAQRVDRLEVDWPSGAKQVLEGLPVVTRFHCSPCAVTMCTRARIASRLLVDRYLSIVER